MTSTTFFIIFIPILAILLLAINLLLAPHNPYQEKDSAFECGFHSFLGQNRTQFSVSFFIFALLFLLFDLEILLVYPYSVSSYTNDIYGLVIMMVFFVLLTLGFIFELGKNALTIDSRQTSSYSNGDTATPLAFLARSYKLQKSSFYTSDSKKRIEALIYKRIFSGIRIVSFPWIVPQFTTLGLESNILYSIINAIVITIKQDIRKAVGNYVKEKLIIYYNNSSLHIKGKLLLAKLEVLHHYFVAIQQLLFMLCNKYSLLYSIFVFLRLEYLNLLNGNIRYIHLKLFLFIGFYCNSVDYYYWLIIMLLSNCIKELIQTSGVCQEYTKLCNSLVYISKIIYLLSLTMCINSILDIVIFPLLKTLISVIKHMFDSILNMMGFNKGESSRVNDNKNPNPNPGPKKDSELFATDSDEKRKNSPASELERLKNAFTEFKKGNVEFMEIENRNKINKIDHLVDLCRDYDKYLTKEDKVALYKLMSSEIKKFNFDQSESIHEFWKMKKESNKEGWDKIVGITDIFQRNSKQIQEQLGGKKSDRSITFRSELEKFKTTYAKSYKEKESVVKAQLAKSRQTDNLLQEYGMTFSTLVKVMVEK